MWTDERILGEMLELYLPPQYENRVIALVSKMRDELTATITTQAAEIERLTEAGLNAAYGEVMYRDGLAESDRRADALAAERDEALRLLHSQIAVSEALQKELAELRMTWTSD